MESCSDANKPLVREGEVACDCSTGFDGEATEERKAGGRLPPVTCSSCLTAIWYFAAMSASCNSRS
jgi:hypothetical protein